MRKKYDQSFKDEAVVVPYSGIALDLGVNGKWVLQAMYSKNHYYAKGDLFP